MGGVFYVGWMAVHGGGVRYDDFKAIGNPDHANAQALQKYVVPNTKKAEFLTQPGHLGRLTHAS